ncbi:hypothetical protein WJX75_004899 [Coccomyxa subellipsoidea]|uniref:GYF domain-containing protein n=1 Tax=Coccomyxa subellipsoidea TaxID=248742 RepID=A0ABR2YJT1_9CHLO
MAGAGKRDDEDNILAHLLPLTAGAVSPFGFVEEDEEEVNYSETDEDLQSADLPGRGQREASLGGPAQEERSRAGAAPAASERKHEPISWHQWQGPAEHSKKDVATGRGGSEEGEQKTAAPTSSKDAHPEDAACTRVRRRERSDPTLGPPGPLELEETNEEAELRRARKKTSMWDVDAPASASNDDRAGPPEADAGKTRKRSRTPPGPPRLPSPPPAFDHPHSPRRRGRMSVSPPRRRVAISIDNLGPPRRVGRSPPWDPPSGQWQPGPGGQSPPHTWHLEDCGRSPWRHWPPPLRYFGGPPPGRDPLRPDLRDALPLPQPRYPGEWEPGRRSPPLRHLARGPFDRSRSPGRERRVAHSPGWPSRDAPPAHIHPGSLSYRRRSSPPRRSISPAFIDSRLPLRPRRVSVERRGAAEAGAERRQRHIGTSPAARRRSAERKPESRVPASKSSRLQVSSSSKEAAVRERPGEGTAGRSNDGKHGSRAADPPCAEKKEERKDEKASGASGEKRSAEKRAGPEQAARAGLPASAHEIVGEAEDRKGNASEKELKAGGTLAAQSDNKPNSSPAGATQQQKASDAANGNGHAADRNLKRRGAGDTPPPELPLPGPPRLAQSRLDQSAGPSLPAPSKHDEHRMEWLYLDPKGETQGPCSIADFKKWLGALRVQAHMRREYEEFQSCLVWRKDDRDRATRTTLRKLLG